MVRVKVCGVSRVESVAMLDGLVDYIGFVSSKRVSSPRVLPPSHIRDLASHARTSAAVAVLHGYSPGEAARVAFSSGVEVLQYHSPIDPLEAVRLSQVLEQYGLSLALVIEWTEKVWRPMDPCMYWRVLKSEGVRLEYLLLDAAKGSGAPLPLRMAARAAGCIPRLGLAGGLTPASACEAASTGAFLLDVSRGVESGVPGAKDPGLVAWFVYSARRCSAAL